MVARWNLAPELVAQQKDDFGYRAAVQFAVSRKEQREILVRVVSITQILKIVGVYCLAGKAAVWAITTNSANTRA